MKTDDLDGEFQGERRRQYMRALLDDLRALELMIEGGMIESGVRRIGAEQEMFLVDRGWRPAPAALDLLERLPHSHFTTELGAFNLEMNLDPHGFGGDCLRRLEAQIGDRLDEVRRAGAELGVEVVLAGILPSIRKSDLGMHNMVPKPRYQLLNRVMKEMRGGTAYEVHIKGVDEIFLQHDSVMLEACNTSFQVHLQVAPAEFANLYNIAQVVAGPVLACSPNSPLLFGKRLWMETRIALFQQSVDTRSASTHLRESTPRVTFGSRWVKESVLELYRDDIARFRALVGTGIDEDPLALVKQGIAPELKALRLHNGTVYRWNRPCYGLTDGKPHLRVEYRALPAGPSVADSVASGALWLGLMNGLAARYPDVTEVFEFEHALHNFTTAARQGLGAHLVWMGGEELPAGKLVLDELVPIAAEGLDRAGVDPKDRDRYLGIVERRVKTGRTGARWLLNSLAAMKDQGTLGQRLHALTAATVARQKKGLAVADWEPAALAEAGGWQHTYLQVEQYMTTDLVTVRADDSVELAANLMEWRRVRHVMVEDDEHRFLGLVSYRSILRLLAQGDHPADIRQLSVSDVMRKEIHTVAPETPTLDAIRLMREHRIACLPVVLEGRLVGVITEADFLHVAGDLLEQRLGPAAGTATPAVRSVDGAGATSAQGKKAEDGDGGRD